MSGNFVIARKGEDLSLEELRVRISDAFAEYELELHHLTRQEFAQQAKSWLESGQLPSGSIVITPQGCMTDGPDVN